GPTLETQSQEMASEFPLVDVHNGSVRSTCPIGESQALVQASGGYIGSIHPDIHRVSSSLACLMQCRVHQRAPDTGPTKLRDDVQLCEIALQAAAPDRRTAPDNSDAVGTVA